MSRDQVLHFFASLAVIEFSYHDVEIRPPGNWKAGNGDSREHNIHVTRGPQTPSWPGMRPECGMARLTDPTYVIGIPGELCTETTALLPWNCLRIVPPANGDDKIIRRRRGDFGFSGKINKHRRTAGISGRGWGFGSGCNDVDGCVGQGVRKSGNELGSAGKQKPLSCFENVLEF